MKRIMIILAASLLMFADVAAAGRGVNTGSVTSLVRTYRLEEGFDVVSVGRLGLGLAKLVANASVETEDEKAALSLIDHLNKIIVVHYEGAQEKKREKFDAELARLLSRAEKILEVKDEGDTVNIYGTSDGTGDDVSDLMIYVPGECTLVCLFGKISAEKIGDLIEITVE